MDVVLAKLRHFVLNVAGRFSLDLQTPFLAYICLHREEEAICAASQFMGIYFLNAYPLADSIYMSSEKWESIVNMIASNNTSPGMKHLALHLLFAAYVLGSQLTGHNPWIEARYVEHLLRDANPSCLVHQLVSGLNLLWGA